MPPTRTIKQQTITKPIPEIKTNDKILDALTVITNPETRVFTMEGFHQIRQDDHRNNRVPFKGSKANSKVCPYSS